MSALDGITMRAAMIAAAIIVTILPAGPGLEAEEDEIMASELLQNWRDALGGREKLERIESIYMKTALETAGLCGTLEEWRSSDGKRRQSIDLGVYKSLTVVDGQGGWTMGPNGNVVALSGSGLKREVTGVYLGTFSHLLPGRMEGRVDYEGKDESGRYHVLQIEPDGGQAARFFIDPETWLPAMMQTSEGSVNVTFEMGDWRAVDGVMFPFHQKQTSDGHVPPAELATQEIRFGEPLDEALFAKPGGAAAQVAFASGRRSLGIPIEVVHNHIYLPVRINGSEPIPFLLDTGAAMSVISTELAQRLGLETKGEMGGQGAGEGSVAIALTEVSRLGVQGVEIPDQTFASMPLSPLRAYVGRPIHGILGFNFINRFVVEIQYAEKRINLYDPRSYEMPAAADAVPITFEHNLPVAEAAIGLPGGATQQGRFLVDTGASLAVNVNLPYAESHGVLAAIPGTIEAPGGFGVGGEVKARIGRLADFRVGGTTLPSPIVTLSQDTKGALASPDFAGVLGAEILRRFTVAFDYTNQRIILETNSDFDDPFEFNTVGAFIIAAGAQFEAYEVFRVLDGSTAERAGLREGDRLIEVNGRPASEMTLHEIEKLFATHGGSIELKLRRGDETLVKKIERRRMV